MIDDQERDIAPNYGELFKIIVKAVEFSSDSDESGPWIHLTLWDGSGVRISPGPGTEYSITRIGGPS